MDAPARRSRWGNQWLPALGIVAIVFALAISALRARVRAPDAVVEAGRHDYLEWCQPCHGSDAHGRGPLAAKLGLEPPDLTTIAKREGGTFLASELTDFVDGRKLLAAHIDRAMPNWGPIFEAASRDDAEGRRANDHIAAILSYLWTIQR